MVGEAPKRKSCTTAKRPTLPHAHTHTRSRRARAILPSKNPLDIPTAGEHKEERSQQKGNKHRAARSGEIKTLPPTLKKGLRDLVRARVGRAGKERAAGLCFSYAGPRDAGAARNRDRENARIRLVCKRIASRSSSFSNLPSPPTCLALQCGVSFRPMFLPRLTHKPKAETWVHLVGFAGARF